MDNPCHHCNVVEGKNRQLGVKVVFSGLALLLL